MKVVLLNAGSGSQKCLLFELPGGPFSDQLTGIAKGLSPLYNLQT